MERKLASIQRVVDVVKHPNADTLDLITVLGWQVVNKMGALKKGDLCVFFEIDSVLPPISEFAFLENKHYRIKSCKLRSYLSQGLVMPLSILEKVNSSNWQYNPEINGLVHMEYDQSAPSIEAGEPTVTSITHIPIEEGLDVTEALGVVKYEPSQPKQLSGVAKGNFPHFLRKTDAERFQSLSRGDIAEFNGNIFVRTLKLDGTSFTAFVKNNEFGVCSRNLELKPDETGKSVYWFIANKYDLANKLMEFCKNNNFNIMNMAIQGEIVGPGIQKNPLGLTEPELRIFDVFDIDNQVYVSYDDEVEIAKLLNIPTVPFLGTYIFDSTLFTVDYLLKWAEGNYEGTDNPQEGNVYKSVDNAMSTHLRDRMKFKVINNEYLLKNGE